MYFTCRLNQSRIWHAFSSFTPLRPTEYSYASKQYSIAYQFMTCFAWKHLQLLIGAIQRDYQEAHLCHFAGQLLIMALGFIVRVIKSEVIREGYSESDRGKNYIF